MSGGNKQKSKEKEEGEERRKLAMAFVCLILVFLLFAGFLIKIGVDKALYNRFEDRGLPRINIKLNEVSLEDELEYDNNLYRVIAIDFVKKSSVNMNNLLKFEKKDTLVLMTCAGTLLDNGDATHRLIITAVRK